MSLLAGTTPPGVLTSPGLPNTPTGRRGPFPTGRSKAAISTPRSAFRADKGACQSSESTPERQKTSRRLSDLPGSTIYTL